MGPVESLPKNRSKELYFDHELASEDSGDSDRNEETCGATSQHFSDVTERLEREYDFKESESLDITGCREKQFDFNDTELLDNQREEQQQQQRAQEDSHDNSDEISLNERENPDKELHQRVVDSELSVILEYLLPQPVLDDFKMKEFLPYLTVRDTEESQTTTDRNRRIVQNVRAKGKRGFEFFKECLTRTNQVLLRTYLEKVESGDDTDLEELRKELKAEADARERREKRKDAAAYEIKINVLVENLTSSIKRGKEFTGEEDVKERLNVQGSNTLEYCDTIKIVIEQGTTDHQLRRIGTAVNEIKKMVGVKITEAAVKQNNSVSLNMPCSSCEEMRRVLKTLKGDEFQTGISKLTKALEETYDDEIEIQAKIDTEKVLQVHDNLRDQGVIGGEDENRFCDEHPDSLCEFYCSDHDAFCCEKCVHGTHRTCSEVRQCTTDAMLKAERDELTSNLKREYRVRIDEPGLCTTYGSYILPNGELILTDNVNNRLKKLDIYYKLTGYCDMLDVSTLCDDDIPSASHICDVCVVDDGKIVVSFGWFVKFMDVKQNPVFEGETKVRLQNVCYLLAWHQNSFYYTDNRSVYKCNAEGNDQELVHTFQGGRLTCKRLIVSRDGRYIYIAAGRKGLLVVDIESKHTGAQSHAVFIKEELKDCTDICVVSDDNLLVCDFESQAVFLVAFKEGAEIRKVADESNGLQRPRSLSFDKADSTVIVGRLGRDFITVFQGLNAGFGE